MKAIKISDRRVKRETGELFRGLPICLELGPVGLELWLKGTRDKYLLPYGAAFSTAAKLAAETLRTRAPRKLRR